MIKVEELEKELIRSEKRLEKENQMKKDDERRRTVSEELSLMTQAIKTIKASRKLPTEKENRIPFNTALAEFIKVNADFRNLLPKKDIEMIDKLTSKCDCELTDILLHNGFGFKPRHAVVSVIKELLAGELQSKSYRTFRLANKQKVEDHAESYVNWFRDKGSVQDNFLITLVRVVYLGDKKYVAGFVKTNKFPTDRRPNMNDILKLMDNLKTFLIANRIPWREVRLEEIIKAIEDPEGRVVRLGRTRTESWPNASHPKHCECPVHIKMNIALPEKNARKYMKEHHSNTWGPVVPRSMLEEFTRFSDKLFKMCSEGIQK